MFLWYLWGSPLNKVFVSAVGYPEGRPALSVSSSSPLIFLEGLQNVNLSQEAWGLEEGKDRQQPKLKCALYSDDMCWGKNEPEKGDGECCRGWVGW